MKRIQFFLTFIVIIMLVSCDNSDQDKTPIDFRNANWRSDYKTIMMIFTDNITIMHHDSVQNSSFTINNAMIPPVWEQDEIDHNWYFVFNSDSLLDLISSGIQINYSLSINSKTYSGNIIFPEPPVITWPAFSMDNDFAMNWSLSAQPDVHIIHGFICDQNYISDFRYKTWQLDGNARQFTLPRNFYSDFDDEDMYFQVNLLTVNYDADKEFIVITHNEEIFQYENDIKKSNIP